MTTTPTPSAAVHAAVSALTGHFPAPRTRAATATRSSLLESRVRDTLDRLHAHARSDLLRIALIAPLVVPDFFGLRAVDDATLSRKMRGTYLPVSRSQGHLLYLIARAIGARRIVEFGTSFGVSTIYLAAAVRDNGGGVVVGTEIEPSKQMTATENLRQAGLADLVDVRLGDAALTLADVSGPVDMVLLDGWKDGYLPILKLLEPKLRQGAVVLADNIFMFRKTLGPYVEYVQSGANGFVSSTLEIADGFELSVFTGRPGAEPHGE
jgi:predicted O-methyltransferase YrrM